MPDFEMLAATKRSIDSFCKLNGIHKVGREFHFEINGQKYMIGRRKVMMEQTDGYRKLKLAQGTSTRIIYISATQKDLERIYNDLKSGYTLDGEGRRIDG